MAMATILYATTTNHRTVINVSKIVYQKYMYVAKDNKNIFTVYWIFTVMLSWLENPIPDHCSGILTSKVGQGDLFLVCNHGLLVGLCMQSA